LHKAGITSTLQVAKATLFSSAFWDKRFGLRKDFSKEIYSKNTAPTSNARYNQSQREKKRIPFSFALMDDGGRAIAMRKIS
jgi:hypothetical protein